MLWRDETIYTLRSKLARKNWRLKNEKYIPECMVDTIKQDRRIKILSCFSYNWVGEFYWTKNRLDADKYHYILQYKMRKSVRKLFRNGDYVFQHDNDPKHCWEDKEIFTKYWC